MENVHKAILVFDDGTTEEYTTFIGEFVNEKDNISHTIFGCATEAQLAWSMTRLNYRYKQLLEKRFSQKEDDIIGK